MVVAEVNWVALVAAFGTLLTAISGCLLSYAAVVKSRREAATEAEADCEKRLKAAREEAERVADELHKARMRKAAG